MILKETAKIISKEYRGGGICDIALETSVSDYARAGQFINLYLPGTEHMLPRPISICEVLRNTGALRIVFRIAGAGTQMISNLPEGSGIEIMGPLGNGYPVDGCGYKRVILAGGGIGIPPLLECAKELKSSGVDIVTCVGIKSASAGEAFLVGELEKYSEVYVSSDDGTIGVPGNVIDCIRKNEVSGEAIFACGPKVMLKALKEYSESKAADCYISLEERMACGIGACLGCVCDTVSEHPHFKVKKARVCKDGPVFDASEVVL